MQASFQQRVSLTPQAIEQIRQETNQKWRDCQRKKYEIWVVKAPAGYIFGNKLEQPNVYKTLIGKSRERIPFMEKSLVQRLCEGGLPNLAEAMKSEGFYQTDGNMIVLMGTAGELWTVKPEKLAASYRMIGGGQINTADIKEGKWFKVERAAESFPSAVGICIPKKYFGFFQTSWGAMVTMNNRMSDGHGEGDILVVPKAANGQLDYANASPTNNAVFANTYNLNVGGWSQSGYVTGDAKALADVLTEVEKDPVNKIKFSKVIDQESIVKEWLSVFVDPFVKKVSGVTSGLKKSNANNGDIIYSVEVFDYHNVCSCICLLVFRPVGTGAPYAQIIPKGCSVSSVGRQFYKDVKAAYSEYIGLFNDHMDSFKKNSSSFGIDGEKLLGDMDKILVLDHMGIFDAFSCLASVSRRVGKAGGTMGLKTEYLQDGDGDYIPLWIEVKVPSKNVDVYGWVYFWPKNGESKDPFRLELSLWNNIPGHKYSDGGDPLDFDSKFKAEVIMGAIESVAKDL